MDRFSATLVPEAIPSTNAPVTAKQTSPFWSSLWRLLLVLSLATGAILTTVVASVPSAYAATANEALPQTSLPATYSGVRNPTRNVPVPTNVHDTSSHISPFKPKTQAKMATPAASPVSSGTPLNGLGDSSLYTFIDKSLSDHLDLKVNVANGNLVLHTAELQISGRGSTTRSAATTTASRTGGWPITGPTGTSPPVAEPPCI
ncbi:hypothetical protein [Dictyobacter kobayashii]|uniref:Uncharacterized protein n=1 Tax=Dictyobacter kobayashii TaxID=2014872 RepID=A0A402AKB0_9CHLR|nr:hypothetical protein [Dictyobacter kobayashii]GCE19523.1 hypothetical protein KDK_33230 [Dictyobacter kobayashii]